MKLIDNINDLLGGDIKQAVQLGARLQIAASCFSIYAYEAFKRELESVGSFEFIFTSPAFMPDDVTDAAKKEWREFHIPIMQKTMAGNAVFFGDGNGLAACFEEGASDSVKINVAQIFQRMSPNTEVRCI